MNPAERLERALASLDVTTTARQRHQLLALAESLLRWSRRFNLTSIRTLDGVVDRHLVDSLAINPYIDGTRLIDVGTGAGFPGLPLAILRPDVEFTLLDAVGKKIRFVVQMAAELELENVTGLHARVPEYVPEAPFTTVTTRAYADIPGILRDCEHLLTDGGRILAMKGQPPTAELATLAPTWQYKLERLRVPNLEEQRHVAIIARRR